MPVLCDFEWCVPDEDDLCVPERAPELEWCVFEEVEWCVFPEDEWCVRPAVGTSRVAPNRAVRGPFVGAAVTKPVFGGCLEDEDFGASVFVEEDLCVE